MPVVQKYAPGAPCWFELGTTDQEAAKTFYGSLFGWEIFDSVMPGDSGFTYTLFRLKGKDVGGGYKLMPDMIANGVPPHWMVYFMSYGVDASAEKVKELGGQLIMGPHDIPGVGRMAVCTDPTGATFSIFQTGDHSGAQIINEPNAVGWSELATRDVPKAAEFYKGLFNWTTKPSAGLETYLEFSAGGDPCGGLLPMDANWEGVPPHWGIYIVVDDAKATTEKAKGLGGVVRHGPFEAPGVGWITIMADPQGAGFSIIELLKKAA